MSKIRELISLMLTVLPIIVGLRATVIVFKMSMQEEDEAARDKKRLKNMVIFVVIAECAMSLLYLVLRHIT